VNKSQEIQAINLAWKSILAFWSMSYKTSSSLEEKLEFEEKLELEEEAIA
jgi:hypothetical protein